MAVLNGNNFRFMVSETELGTKVPFAHSQNCSVSFSNNLVEATLGRSSGWAEFVTGKKSMTVSFSGLSDYGTITDRHNLTDLTEFLVDAEGLYFSIGDGEDVMSGKGYVTEVSIQGSADNITGYTGVFTVTDFVDDGVELELEYLLDSDGNQILSDNGEPLQAYV